MIVAGANGQNNVGGFSGAAYTFRNIGGTWFEEQEILPAISDPFDLFGSSVSIDEDLIVVGSPQNNFTATSAGAA